MAAFSNIVESSNFKHDKMKQKQRNNMQQQRIYKN